MIKINEEIIKTNALKGHKEDYFVLKSNAYGFGMARIASLLIMLDFHKFAVITLDEAIALRELDPNGVILLLGVFDKSKLFLYEKYDIVLSINSLDDLKSLYMHKLKVQIAINTGMNRFGLRPEEALEAINLTKKTALKLTGLYSHNATHDIINIKAQEEAFWYVKKTMPNCEAHFAASSLFLDPKYKIRRIGKMLYQNALGVYGTIVKINYLYKGEKLGYDYSFEMPNDGYIGIIDLGYADGLMRKINGFLVYIDNRYYHMVGYACMNHSFVYLGKDKLALKTLVHFISPYNNQINYELFSGKTSYEIYLDFLKKY